VGRAEEEKIGDNLEAIDRNQKSPVFMVTLVPLCKTHPNTHLNTLNSPFKLKIPAKPSIFSP
jgi:hypothetical protein